jgi:hypothetical protein
MNRIMKNSLYLIIASLVILSCSSGIKVTNSWKNPSPDTVGKTYRNIFIAALTDNQFARNTMEENLAEAAGARGYTITRSSMVLTPTFSQQKIPSKDDILQKVKESNSDAIFTVALISKEDRDRYVQGEVNTSPSYGWYGSFGGYYGTIAGPIYTPGYYTTDKTYYLESNLFDAKSEKILWSARTEAYNPSSIEKFCKQYTETMIKQLERDGVIKK